MENYGSSCFSPKGQLGYNNLNHLPLLPPTSPPTQAPLQGASSFFGGGSNSLAIDWSLTANLPWPTLDDVAWEAAADAKLRAVGDACCTFSFPDFSNVSHAFPSLAALWEAEGLL